MVPVDALDQMVDFALQPLGIERVGFGRQLYQFLKRLPKPPEVNGVAIAEFERFTGWYTVRARKKHRLLAVPADVLFVPWVFLD